MSRNASLGVHGYALVFSIASRKSFEIIDQVNDSLLNTLGDAPDVPRVLVGSMKDLAHQRQVSQQVSSFSSSKPASLREFLT
jgi:Ras family protein